MEKKVQQLIITCPKESQHVERKLAMYFYGWLMERLSADLVNQFHHTGMNPLSLYIDERIDQVDFVLGLLNQTVLEQVTAIFARSMTIELVNGKQKQFSIVQQTMRQLDYQALSRQFYLGKAPNIFKLRIVSPTAFKTQGTYFFWPEVRLFLQSLMRKANYLDKATEKIDTDLLSELCHYIKIIGYRIRSQPHFIHQAYVNGFCGDLTFRCSGNQTLRNYFQTLLEIGEITGVGVKTSLGMGGIKIKQWEQKHGSEKS